MKKLLLAMASLVALGVAAPASAADMPVKAAPAAPVARSTIGPASTSVPTSAARGPTQTGSTHVPRRTFLFSPRAT